MRVIAIDPGVMSGYALGVIAKNGSLEYFPFQAVDDVDDLWARLKGFKPRYIVIESFEFRKGKKGFGGLNLFPVELIGVARLYSLEAEHQCAVYKQTPAQGKGYFTNPVLRANGLYKMKLEHGLDASRHLLQWCMFGAGNQFIGQQAAGEFARLAADQNFWREG